MELIVGSLIATAALLVGQLSTLHSPAARAARSRPARRSLESVKRDLRSTRLADSARGKSE
jgi:hypothetical protein